MVKNHWLAITLGVGILVGIFIGRQSTADPVAAAESAAAQTPGEGRPRAAEPRATAAAGQPSAANAAPPPALQFARESSGPQDVSAPPPRQLSGFVVVNAEPGAMPESQHDIMMREERDDSWAYLREAEIDASIIAETGAGNFRKDYLECRATLCEMHLSGMGPQAIALRKWFEAQNERGRAHPMTAGAELEPFSWSMQEDPQRGTAEAQVFYRKPQPPQPLQRPR